MTVDADALAQIVLDHAGLVYDATIALHHQVRTAHDQATIDLPRWAQLDKRQRQRFVRDTAGAVADLHAATLTISSETR